MGGCVAKGPVKISPHCDENNAHDKLLKTSDSRLRDVTKVGTKESGKERPSEEKSTRSELKPIIIVPNSNVTTTTKIESGSNLINTETKVVKPGIAYDVQFHDDEHQINSPQTYPRRLKKLDDAPKLTAEMLKQKQDMAEAKRLKELQKKTETMSKHRRDVFKAREFGKLQEAEKQFYTKLVTSEMNRRNQMKKIVEKQKEREERARKVRQKAGYNNNINYEDNIIHVDETYNSEGSSEDLTWDDNDVRTSSTEYCEANEDRDSLDNFFTTTEPCPAEAS